MSAIVNCNNRLSKLIILDSLNHWLKYQNSKVWRLDNMQTYRYMSVTNRKIEDHKICLPKYRKIRAILYNWKTADRIETISLRNRAEWAENTADWHHARSYHRFQDIRHQYTSVSLIVKSCFPYTFLLFATDLNEVLGIFNKSKKLLFKNTDSSREITNLWFWIFRPFQNYIRFIGLTNKLP